MPLVPTLSMDPDNCGDHLNICVVRPCRLIAIKGVLWAPARWYTVDAMRRRAKLILLPALVLLSGGLAAQTFKCVDAAGKITYSSTKCDALGLRNAGEVKDRINVSPAYKPPPNAPKAPPPQAPASANEAPKTETPAAAEKSAEPARRCFVVSTPKGKVTRCNVKPEE